MIPVLTVVCVLAACGGARLTYIAHRRGWHGHRAWAAAASFLAAYLAATLSIAWADPRVLEFAERLPSALWQAAALAVMAVSPFLALAVARRLEGARK
ncbi:hypothetical protein [Planomonospora venezuelensis]|uniref:Uncharacterized protein n=1 Tax=Planomonospora venezuelensis TaxID=1999 RepID=A0A841D9B7_PLAVE|nr:hypothetical protein [Planomonospora venezuelensis]MBB5965084.1 hypothetical protein [Planomonospora venezuelensis]GIN04998.1 hypothetical protein Pve01_66560 [Planomonospora venezuelensis]